MKTVRDRFGRCRHSASARGHFKRVRAGTIDLVEKSYKPKVRLVRRLNQERPRSIAKEDAGGAVGVVDDARHRVGTDHQNFAMSSSRDQVGGGRQPINESRTGGTQIETPGAGGFQLLLHKAGSGREKHIWCDGTENDRVEL